MLKGSCRSSFCIVLGLLSLAGASTRAVASSIPATINYSTGVSVGSQGLTGSSLVGFQGINGGQITAPETPFEPGSFVFPFPAGFASRVPLGAFTLAAPAVGTLTGYDHTPFTLTFKVNSVDANPTASNPNSFVVQGTLNGTVTSSGHSDVIATFGVMTLGDRFLPNYAAGGFSANGMSYGLQIPGFQVPLQASSTPALGDLVSATTVPETNTLLLFSTLSLGFVAWRKTRIQVQR